MLIYSGHLSFGAALLCYRIEYKLIIFKWQVAEKDRRKAVSSFVLADPLIQVTRYIPLGKP